MPTKKRNIGRRTFIGGAAGTTLGVMAAPRLATGVLGANERVVLGIIGAGGMGRNNHMNGFRKKGAVFAAVCDVYEPNRDEAIKLAKRGNPNEVKGYNEHEKLLERKDLDAVVIASPEHWHHDHLIDTVRAGKDAYSEKPMSWSIEEGANMVREVRKTDRIVQIGMQRRSAPACHEAKELIDTGVLGNVHYVRAEWFWNFSKTFDGQVDRGKLDWERFRKDRSDMDYTPARFAWWRYYWPFSGGNVTDQGVHLMDVVQWFMGVSQPISALQFGEVYRMEPADTPDVFNCTFEYPKFMATWTLCYTNNTWRNSWHITFHGDKASLGINEAGWRLCDKVDDWKKGMPKAKKESMPGGVTSTGPHHDNFLACIKTRKQPNATVETGFQGVRTLHLANIAYHKRKRAELAADGVTVKV
jgi:predicted dehydrogenase